MKLKEKNPKLKILISCGGWGANGQFEGIVGSDEARRSFSANMIEFCRKHGFDGIDLDWEFPGASHKKNFGLLAKAMYEEFKKESKKAGKPRLLTSIATAAGDWLLKNGYDIPVLCKYLDMVNVMTYDLYGNWYNKVGHHSALYHSPEETGQDRELNTVNKI
jgi:chitinase